MLRPAATRAALSPTRASAHGNVTDFWMCWVWPDLDDAPWSAAILLSILRMNRARDRLIAEALAAPPCLPAAAALRSLHLSSDGVPLLLRVPAANLLGGENRGLAVMMSGLDLERAWVSVGATGVAERALDLAVGWARERRQFGQPIGETPPLDSGARPWAAFACLLGGRRRSTSTLG